MPNTADIISKLKIILNQRFGIDTAKLNAESRLQDLGVDSLHVVYIMLDLESELEIKIDDLSLPSNPSLAQVAAAISGSIVTQAQV